MKANTETLSLPAVETIKPARTQILKKTDHHSYTGRAEFIASLIEATGKTDFEKADYNAIVARVKARYPWHASPAHVVAAIKAYLKAKAKKAAKAEQQAAEQAVKAAAKASQPAKGKPQGKAKGKGKAKAKASGQPQSQPEAKEQAISA